MCVDVQLVAEIEEGTQNNLNLNLLQEIIWRSNFQFVRVHLIKKTVSQTSLYSSENICLTTQCTICDVLFRRSLWPSVTL